MGLVALRTGATCGGDSGGLGRGGGVAVTVVFTALILWTVLGESAMSGAVVGASAAGLWTSPAFSSQWREGSNSPTLKSSCWSLFRSSRESYGDEAIGYVYLKREQLTKTCILKCKVCPEHRIHSKRYSVTLTVNEEDEKILDVKCHDCAASNECYWRRSTLASIRASKKYIELNELKKTNMAEPSLPDNSLFRQNVLKIAEQKQLDSQLFRHNFVLKNHKLKCLSIHELLQNFYETVSSSADEFLEYASKVMSEDLCRMAEKCTRSQSDTCTWHELRYGRITASRIHEAVHCKTLDGWLVQQIIGASKIFESQAMERGKRLEKKVLLEVAKMTGLRF
ncbi:hypothetical protein ALC57_04899 [Trachymyrmex cornetzi]|uniref:Uncharacterized protein n=1 Tax=Trachymyrmex cornetzi TaxID=471704 RepID=A0A195EE43_9HYME|nr:hypothetical protein ALC57_04899 [Trachymyrmex cornetzi]